MPTVTGIATSFIDFTRASNATVTDSDGKVKWAPHNLLRASEQFDSGSWDVKTGVTFTANSTAAPNGTTTADTIAFASFSYDYQRYFYGSALTGVTMTFGIWLWSATGKATIVLRLAGATTASDAATKVVNLTTTPTYHTVTRTFTSTDTNADAGLDNRSSLGGDDIAGNVIAWGAHLYRSDLAMQPNTSAYPMYNPTTPKNLLGYTEDLTAAAYWTNVDTADVTTGVTNPRGLSGATLVYPTSSGTDRIIYRGSIVGGTVSTPYTLSVYAKASGINFLYFGTFGGGTGTPSLCAFFDLQNGTKTQTGSYFTSASITPVGDGWYRCTATANATLAGVYPIFGVANANNSNTVTASGTSGIYLWGAQLSDSASLDSYVPVHGAAVTSAAYYGPRRDFDPVTLACKGLLVEELRSNLFLYSDQFDVSANWAPTGATVSSNTIAAPSGIVSADTLVEDTSTGNHRVYQTPSCSSSTAYTFSLFIKAAGRTQVRILETVLGGAYFDLSTGTITTTDAGVTASIQAVGSGWYRCRITATTGGSQTVFVAQIQAGSANSTSYTGTGIASLYLWGAQLEPGSFATSYIPTGAATATRNADVASVSTQAFPYSATEGTLVASVMFANYVSGDGRLGGVVGFGSSSPRIILAMGSSSTRPFFAQMYDGTNATNPPKPNFSDLSVNTPHKVGMAYTTASGGLSAFTWDGISTTSSTNSNALNLSGMATMQIGTQPDAPIYLNGHIRQITYLPRRVSNAELVTRST